MRKVTQGCIIAAREGDVVEVSVKIPATGRARQRLVQARRRDGDGPPRRAQRRARPPG